MKDLEIVMNILRENGIPCQEDKGEIAIESMNGAFKECGMWFGHARIEGSKLVFSCKGLNFDLADPNYSKNIPRINQARKMCADTQCTCLGCPGSWWNRQD